MTQTEKDSMADEDFAVLLASVAEVKAYLDGTADRSAYRVHVPAQVDVKAIRARAKLTQDAFARRYGFSPGAVRDWEQGRRQPEAAARILLTVIDREPEAVERALAAH